MTVEDFKRTAELQEKLQQLNSQLSEKTTARAQNIIKDFEAKTLEFFDSNGFKTTQSAKAIEASYAGASIQVQLPSPEKRSIGATALISLSINGAPRWNIALIHDESRRPSTSFDVKKPSVLVRLQKDVSDLTAIIANYNVQPTYRIKYFADKPQMNAREKQGHDSDSVEDALADMLKSGN